MRSRPLRIALLTLTMGLLGTSGAAALTLEPIGKFAQPTYVTSDPGNPDRLFVVERLGTIQLIEGGTVSQFTDLSSKVGCTTSCTGERGLLSIALSPDFDQSGRLFVDYVNNSDGKIHIDELVATGPGHESADLASLSPLLTIEHRDAANHNGGQLQIGPDGDLYVSTGDGGGSDDQFHHAQDPASLLGKILRLDPDSFGPPAIWSLGLRNPYRFSFDSLTGDLTIADVGQGAREEIDFAPSPLPGLVGGQGANYGWNCREGLTAGLGTDPECATAAPGAFTDPVFEYAHTAIGGGVTPCAIIGGYVARDSSLGDLYGRYVYGDLCVGELCSIDLADPFASDRSEGLLAPGLNSFGEDSCGRLYVVEGGGDVFRLAGTTAADCSAALTPPPPPAPPPANGTSSQAPALKSSFLAIKAAQRRVEHGKRALLTVRASPCEGRPGTPVGLLRDGRPNGSHLLDRDCVTHFKPLIREAAGFAAIVHKARGYLPAKSRTLRIRLAPSRK
jgi:hypothetical protein